MKPATVIRQTPAFAAGIFALCVALLTTMVVSAAPAYASQPIDPDATTALEIHKFEQPDSLGDATTGLTQDTTGLTPVSGVKFTATRVPGIDLTTNSGQQAAGELTISEAAELVADAPRAASGVTDISGHVSLNPLDVGVYYVEEIETPAGIVASAPFLVALPLTHPQKRDRWLNTVHVYPKNATASITLDVMDQDAVKLGDPVYWTSRSTIPIQPTIDGYRVEEILSENLELVGLPDNLEQDIAVTLDCASCASLAPGVDYSLGYSPDSRVLTIEFLESGLRKLENAVVQDPSAEVKIAYVTTVLASGSHVNEAVLYPSRAAIDDRKGARDTATTKWGPISVLVHEADNPSSLIPGARFELYESAEDASAQRNPIIIDGVQEWTTDDTGRLVVHGLRFSDFVNNLDRETGDDLHRAYWTAPTYLPDGWSWVADAPQAGTVSSAEDYQTLIFLVDREGEAPATQDPEAPTDEPSKTPGDEPGGELPMTGAQIIGALILAAVLVAVGTLLLSRKRRNASESDTAQ